MKQEFERLYDPTSTSFDSYYRSSIDADFKKIRDEIGKYKPLSESDSKKLDEKMIAYISDKAAKKEAFLHCQEGVQVADISPTRGIGAIPKFMEALSKIRSHGKIIGTKTDLNPTILCGESFNSGHKEQAHHITFKE